MTEIQNDSMADSRAAKEPALVFLNFLELAKQMTGFRNFSLKIIGPTNGLDFYRMNVFRETFLGTSKHLYPKSHLA